MQMDVAEACTPGQLRELVRRERVLAERLARRRALQALAASAARAAGAALRRRRQMQRVAEHVARQTQQAAGRALLVEQASQAGPHQQQQRPAPQPALLASASAAAAEHVQRQASLVRQERIITEDVRAMLAAARGALAGRLLELLDVEIGTDSGGWRVCGLRAAGGAGEESAVALGVVARAVDVAAGVMGVPVRFALLPRGSRAAVCGRAGELWPLFAVGGRARDQARLAHALGLLAADVGQLLERLGVEAVGGVGGGEERRGPAAADDIVAGLTQLLLAIETSSFAQ